MMSQRTGKKLITIALGVCVLASVSVIPSVKHRHQLGHRFHSHEDNHSHRVHDHAGHVHSHSHGHSGRGHTGRGHTKTDWDLKESSAATAHWHFSILGFEFTTLLPASSDVDLEPVINTTAAVVVAKIPSQNVNPRTIFYPHRTSPMSGSELGFESRQFTTLANPDQKLSLGLRGAKRGPTTGLNWLIYRSEPIRFSCSDSLGNAKLVFEEVGWISISHPPPLPPPRTSLA